MSTPLLDTAPAASTQPLLTRAIEALCAVAQSLLARLAAPQTPPPNPSPLPKPLAHNPKTAAPRITRALAWLAALTDILAGGRLYHRPTRITVAGLLTSLAPTLFAAATPPAAPAPSRPTRKPRTEAQRAAARLHYMRRVFATVPTSTIATRIARRLGLTEASPEWPHALVTIGEPPAVWATRQHKPPEPLPSSGVLLEVVRRFLAVVPDYHLLE